MAKKSLRSQLNQIRAWAREGRTDAWMAHQLDVPAAELRDFRRRHELTAEGGEEGGEAELRDEIEAEIEAATLEEDEEPADEGEGEGEGEGDGDEEPDAEKPSGERQGRRRRRRRRRRGGRRKALQGTFDHGETDGFGLWLDPAIQDNPTYGEHWAGHRAVEVEVEPDRIVIKRSS
ncbi:MAG: hypothetical protein ACRDL3_11930 [Solirubrobacterales bacterium]